MNKRIFNTISQFIRKFNFNSNIIRVRGELLSLKCSSRGRTTNSVPCAMVMRRNVYQDFNVTTAFLIFQTKPACNICNRKKQSEMMIPSSIICRRWKETIRCPGYKQEKEKTTAEFTLLQYLTFSSNYFLVTLKFSVNLREDMLIRIPSSCK